MAEFGIRPVAIEPTITMQLNEQEARFLVWFMGYEVKYTEQLLREKLGSEFDKVSGGFASLRRSRSDLQALLFRVTSARDLLNRED